MNKILDSWRHIPYSIKHIREIYRLQKKYLGYIKYPFHDWDKILMYLFLPWLGVKTIHKYHRTHRAHHPENGREKFLKHLDEAVLDWESARFTKPDKPLNAWETCLRFYPQYKNEVSEMLDKLEIEK